MVPGNYNTALVIEPLLCVLCCVLAYLSGLFTEEGRSESVLETRRPHWSWVTPEEVGDGRSAVVRVLGGR